MLRIPALLADWQRLTGLRWSDLARMCEVDRDTVSNWRKGATFPWDRKAQRLADVVGPVLGRTDLVDVIALDRAELAKRRARPAPPAKHPTPRPMAVSATKRRGGRA